MNLHDFWFGLFRGQEGYLDVRAFRQDKRDPLTWRIPVADVAAIDEVLQKHADRNLYFGPTLRKTDANGTKENCHPLRLLFADFDFKDVSEAEARQRLGAFRLQPSALLHSGFGLHVYWLLSEPVEHDAAKKLLRKLAETLGADLGSAEPAHVLRVPGTRNYKYDPPRDVVLETLTPLCYSVEEFTKALGLAPATPTHAPTKRRSAEIHVDRNIALTRLAGALRRQGLDFDAILAALRKHNAEHVHPPVDDQELKQIVRSVCRYAPAEDTFPTTETGDAEFFASIFGDRVRFDWRQGRWLVFAGHRWIADSNGELHRLATEAIRARQAATFALKEGDDRKRRLKWAADGESRRRQENLIALARSKAPLSDPGDGWDSTPTLLATPNGIVDLETGVLRPGVAADRITMSVRVPYDPSAECPLFVRTVKEVFNGDQDLIAYFQRALGYSISGDCREECLFLCWGAGRNGKGTLLNTVGYLLGDYADNLSFSALELHERSSVGNEIAKLVAKRYVTASESGEASRLNEARIKALTGRDPITARFLYREEFTFQPDAKFWLSTNKKPIVRDDSDAFWRRLHLIPFTQSFAGREDQTLKDRLRAEASGILTWLVRGCLAWQRDGLQPPDVVRNATQAYRDESDPLTEFFDACCVMRSDARAKAGKLFDRYKEWALRAGDRKPLGSRTFGEKAALRFGKPEEKSDGRWYAGVGIRDERREPRDQEIQF